MSDLSNQPTQDTLTPQQIKQHLLDLLDIQHQIVEELSDEQLAAIVGGSTESQLQRSLSAPLQHVSRSIESQLQRSSSLHERFQTALFRTETPPPRSLSSSASSSSGDMANWERPSPLHVMNRYVNPNDPKLQGFK